MTKSELIESISGQYTALTHSQVESVINTIFLGIKEALANGEGIEIRGFGSFRLRHRRPREGRNPKTGDVVLVPPKKVPFFKAAKELKALVDYEDLPSSGSIRRSRLTPHSEARE